MIEYQSRNPQFPHQSTADQFFSESQFESYRRLGLHVVREALEGVMKKAGDVTQWTQPPVSTPTASAADERKCKDVSPTGHKSIDLTLVCQRLTTKWYPSIPVTDEAASRLNDQYSEMIKRLSETDLLGLLPSVLANPAEPKWPAGTTQPRDKAFVYMVEQIGLMANVFTEFELEHAANRANPRNRGWMKVFRQWVHSNELYLGLWPRVKESYNPVFQQFVKQLRDEPIDDVPTQN